MRKGTVQSRQLAKEMMKEWFSQPQRDNDEGYALTAGPHYRPLPSALTTGPYHRPLLPALRSPQALALDPLTPAYPPPPLRYADINLALNALESAFIQLTGKAEAKGQFFPQMRKRIAARGHKVADYEVCL